MSGDVQPRKRKDKKKTKRESLDRRSEGDIFARKSSLQDEEDIKEHHHGVHATKMGKEDLHLHVQSDHDTGGHWCAKLLFFSLLAIIFGLIGLIILENRGSSDLDTPLSESRFSEYFEGWVDEHRPGHDDHHEPDTGIDDHDGEPFEEEEDHSEQEEEDTTEVLEGHDDEEEENDGDEEQEANASNNDDDDEVEGNSEDEEDENEIVEDTNSRNKREVLEDDDNDDDDKDEGFEEDTMNDDGNEINQQDDDEENDNDDDAPFEENNTNKVTNRVTEDTASKAEAPNENNESSDKVHKPHVDHKGKNDKVEVAEPPKVHTTTGSDDDFDDADESLEQVVDNDAGEELHLRRKAEEEELAAKAAKRVDEESDSAPLAVKVAVGLALAFVARLVLVKKSVPRKSDEPFQGPPETRRRFTMISPEDDIPVEDAELLDEEIVEDYVEDEDVEEEEEEPELQYSQESGDEDEEQIDEADENARIKKFIPETFEQLNAMYRPKAPQPPVAESAVEKPAVATLAKSLDTRPTVPPRRSPALQQEESKQTVFEPVLKAAQFSAQNFPRDPSPRMYNDQSEKYDSKDMEADEELGDEEEYDDEEIYSGSDEDVEDEEEISDVDDDDLLQRLEAKYGKLPERKYGSDDDDDELDEESWTKVRGPETYVDDDYLDEEIRRANDELFNDNLKPALQIFDSLILKYPENPEALYGKAKVLDRLSTKYKNNQMLLDTIEAYRAVVNLDKKVDDEMFKEVAERCVDRMRFKGMLTEAVPIHRKLIKRFDNDPEPRNQLAVTYLLQNRYAEAKYILHHTLMRWRENGFAQVHYGFILKVHDNDMKAAAALLEEGLNSGANGTQDGRFYFALGDALHRLGRKEDAKQIYQKGADLGLFPSVYQRSLYNVKGLKARPFWTREQTTYESFFAIMQLNWELIRKEGMAALNSKGLYVDEAESLRESGDWKQLELFARGYRIEKNCAKAPITCNIIETFPAARTCKRGQVKFSIIEPGTHVWPHCGPTNCRLRAHLGLVVPPGAKLRVAEEERTWKAGEWLIFDDSFEHEVWHNGTSPRLVLIVDVWHPELTENQRESLSRI